MVWCQIMKSSNKIRFISYYNTLYLFQQQYFFFIIGVQHNNIISINPQHHICRNEHVHNYITYTIKWKNIKCIIFEKTYFWLWLCNIWLSHVIINFNDNIARKTKIALFFFYYYFVHNSHKSWNIQKPGCHTECTYFHEMCVLIVHITELLNYFCIPSRNSIFFCCICSLKLCNCRWFTLEWWMVWNVIAVIFKCRLTWCFWMSRFKVLELHPLADIYTTAIFILLNMCDTVPCKCLHSFWRLCKFYRRNCNKCSLMEWRNSHLKHFVWHMVC